MKTLKYRPVLTSNQISHLISLCKKDLSNDSLSVIAVLAPFKTKIENHGIMPAYVIQNKPSLLESLGFENDNNFSNLSREESTQKAYDRWLQNPDSCNVDELTMVQEHRYLNELMTSEESQDFERNLMETAYKVVVNKR